MGKGTRYPHVETILRRYYNGGRVLELGAGGAVYSDIFDDYVASDLPTTPYAQTGDIDIGCDARQLPFAPESFGLCFAVACLCLIPQPEQVIREVHRCLQIGGKMLVFDYSLHTQRNLAERHNQQGQNVHLNLWTAQKLEGLLREAGFSNIQRLETKPYWKAIVSLWPGFGDRYRPWLMVRAEKR